MDTLIIFAAKYLYLVIVLIGMIVFFTLSKERRIELFLFGLSALPLMFAVLMLASFLYDNPRPFVVGDFTPLIPHAPDNGFPSDHTILSTAIAALIFPYARKTGIALFILALLVGAGRVLAGVHHTVDIIGSMVIAMVVAYAVYRFAVPRIYKYISEKLHKNHMPHGKQ